MNNELIGTAILRFIWWPPVNAGQAIYKKYVCTQTWFFSFGMQLPSAPATTYLHGTPKKQASASTFASRFDIHITYLYICSVTKKQHFITKTNKQIKRTGSNGECCANKARQNQQTENESDKRVHTHKHIHACIFGQTLLRKDIKAIAIFGVNPRSSTTSYYLFSVSTFAFVFAFAFGALFHRASVSLLRRALPFFTRFRQICLHPLVKRQNTWQRGAHAHTHIHKPHIQILVIANIQT